MSVLFKITAGNEFRQQKKKISFFFLNMIAMDVLSSDDNDILCRIAPR